MAAPSPRNAILERTGARTGLLTTAGFGDVAELRRLRMPRLYDMTWEKPAPIVERRLRREVPERMDLSGAVVTPIDLDAVREAVDALLEDGVESLAVSFLHSYANPAHERAVGELLAAVYPDLWVSPPRTTEARARAARPTSAARLRPPRVNTVRRDVVLGGRARPHSARSRRPWSRRSGLHESRHRQSPLHQRQDRKRPCLQHPAQARRAEPTRSRRSCPPPHELTPT